MRTLALTLSGLALAGLGFVAAAFAQEAQPPAPALPPISLELPEESRPINPEAGIRMTPLMARTAARQYVKHVARARYELPEEKEQEATELVARRIMQGAHSAVPQGAELIQRFVEEQVAAQLPGAGERDGFLPKGFGREFGARTLQVLPDIREAVRGISQDIRPMLPAAQQLKMAAELMAFKTAVDGLEETMKQWASGQSQDYSDPFRQTREKQEPTRDENGLTAELKSARTTAEERLKQDHTQGWEEYLKKVIELYGLDEAQAETGRSVLRESQARAAQLAQDDDLNTLTYTSSFWLQLMNSAGRWGNPVQKLVERRREQAELPFKELERQFKERLEQIPTTAQRRGVEQRLEQLLSEMGITEEKP